MRNSPGIGAEAYAVADSPAQTATSTGPYLTRMLSVRGRLRAEHPAVGLRDPRAPEHFGFLSEVELTLLFRAVPYDKTLK